MSTDTTVTHLELVRGQVTLEIDFAEENFEVRYPSPDTIKDQEEFFRDLGGILREVEELDFAIDEEEVWFDDDGYLHYPLGFAGMDELDSINDRQALWARRMEAGTEWQR